MHRDFIGIFQKQLERDEFWTTKHIPKPVLANCKQGIFFKLGRLLQ
jgi:hypothetical protein